MKKISKWLWLMAITMIALTLAFSFAACGGGGNGGSNVAAYVGTYKFYRLKEDSKTYNIGDIYKDHTFNNVTLTADYFVMVLEADGTFTVDSPLPERNAATSPYCNQIHGNMTGTWQTDDVWGAKVTIDGTDIRLLDFADGEIKYEFTVGLVSYTYYFQKIV